MHLCHSRSDENLLQGVKMDSCFRRNDNKTKKPKQLNVWAFNIYYLETYSCSKYFSIIMMADSEITVPGPKMAATFLSNK